MIYSGIPHTTAALFLSGNFIEKNTQVYIITDSHTTREYIEEVGFWIWGKSVRILHHPGEILKLDEYDEAIIVIHTDLLRISGNIENLRRSSTIRIVRDVSISQNILIEKLLEFGYHQSDYPGESATYRRAGAVIQIWQENREYTIEYFDDTIESIVENRGNIRTHRDAITLTSEHFSGGESPLTLSKELLMLLSEIPTLMVSCEFLNEREYIHANFRDTLECSTLTREGSQKVDVSIPQISSLNDLTNFLRENSSDQSPLCITRYHKKLVEFLTTNHLDSIESMEHRHIRESFTLQGSSEYLGKKWKEFSKKGKFHLITEDILGSILVQNRVRKTTIRNLDLLLKIQTGDAVVHREHGIGKYIQILSKRIGLIEREYMEIEYAAGDKVYLPMTELSRITKYVGESDPSLSSLAGKEWERTLSKTDEEIEAIAADILETDAKRSLTTRIAFGAFRDEEEKFEKAFAHTHTPDQRDIIASIRADMEGSHPMDRLIAGDVGFGKTEIAMNAVYKAVLSGVQVAVISPLLILAEEHRETFETRLGAFGVRVHSLTRMTHANEVKNTLQAMKDGTVDVVIGTHRLLSEDIRFRRLGLLIIDEEHRFGVVQKETIKKMKAHVDILSLSATPIPRSLHLALSGLKKISLLTTPPLSKKPIDTIVARWDEGLVKQAIEIERQRKGQIIILHNRIRSLDMIAEDIRELFVDNPPSIVITHGQMPPDTIEDRILAFKHGEYDILLTTTIIENGVNFLGANTIIVSDAEEFGLAQLHQIRGRVGRKDISGVCYLLYRKYELTGQERERLMILAEHSALGSGYEIAMRDMQMRGTGDILGFRQSGKTKEVGISLYFQLLEEKIQTLKNGRKEEVQCKIDLDLSYVIGDDEFDSEMDKLSFFRDIESIETLEDLDIAESTFSAESIPDTMSNLFLMMRASIILKVYGVSRVSKIGNSYHFDFQDTTTPKELRAFLERFDTKNDMIIVSVRKIKIETRHWKDTRAFLLVLVR